jgi:hypothetical protein
MALALLDADARKMRVALRPRRSIVTMPIALKGILTVDNMRTVAANDTAFANATTTATLAALDEQGTFPQHLPISHVGHNHGDTGNDNEGDDTDTEDDAKCKDLVLHRSIFYFMRYAKNVVSQLREVPMGDDVFQAETHLSSRAAFASSCVVTAGLAMLIAKCAQLLQEDMNLVTRYVMETADVCAMCVSCGQTGDLVVCDVCCRGFHKDPRCLPVPPPEAGGGVYHCGTPGCRQRVLDGYVPPTDKEYEAFVEKYRPVLDVYALIEHMPSISNPMLRSHAIETLDKFINGITDIGTKVDLEFRKKGDLTKAELEVNGGCGQDLDDEEIAREDDEEGLHENSYEVELPADVEAGQTSEYLGNRATLEALVDAIGNIKRMAETMPCARKVRKMMRDKIMTNTAARLSDGEKAAFIMLEHADNVAALETWLFKAGRNDESTGRTQHQAMTRFWTQSRESYQLLKEEFADVLAERGIANIEREVHDVFFLDSR